MKQKKLIDIFYTKTDSFGSSVMNLSAWCTFGLQYYTSYATQIIRELHLHIRPVRNSAKIFFLRYFITTLSSIAACLQTTVFACFAGREATSSWVACCLSFCVQNLSARFTENWTDFNRAEMGSSSYSKLLTLILTPIPKVGALFHCRFYSHEHIGNC